MVAGQWWWRQVRRWMRSECIVLVAVGHRAAMMSLLSTNNSRVIGRSTPSQKVRLSTERQGRARSIPSPIRGPELPAVSTRPAGGRSALNGANYGVPSSRFNAVCGRTSPVTNSITATEREHARTLPPSVTSSWRHRRVALNGLPHTFKLSLLRLYHHGT